jgi:hypothetical protein
MEDSVVHISGVENGAVVTSRPVDPNASHELKIETAHEGRSSVAGVDLPNGEFWGVMVAPFIHPQTNLEYPVLVTKRRSAGGDWSGEQKFDAWAEPISDDVPNLRWDEVAPLHPALAAAAALAARGGSDFSSPDYRDVCHALGLDPDPAPNFGDTLKLA